HVVFTIVITEYGRVDGIAAFDGLRLRGEWAGRVVAYRHTDLEAAVGTLGREVEVIFAIFGGRIRGPHLTLSPGHILHVQRYTAVLSRTVRTVHPQYVVVLHAEVITVVIERDARINVVGWMEVEPATEAVRCRISGIDMGNQRLGNGLGR